MPHDDDQRSEEQRLRELQSQTELEKIQAEVDLRKDQNAGRPEPLENLVEQEDRRRVRDQRKRQEKESLEREFGLRDDPTTEGERNMKSDPKIIVDPSLQGGRDNDDHPPKKKEEKTEEIEIDPPKKGGIGIGTLIGILLGVVILLIVGGIVLVKHLKEDAPEPAPKTEEIKTVNSKVDASEDASTTETGGDEDSGEEGDSGVEEDKVTVTLELAIDSDGVLPEDSICSNDQEFLYDPAKKIANCGDFNCGAGLLEAWRSPDRKALKEGAMMTREVACVPAPTEEEEQKPTAQLTILIEPDGIKPEDAKCHMPEESSDEEFTYDPAKKIAQCGEFLCGPGLLEAWRSDERKALKEGESLVKTIICSR